MNQSFPPRPGDADKNMPQSQSGQYSSRLSNQGEMGYHESFRMDENFFRQVINSLEDYAVFTTNIKGHISSWNQGAERLLGFEEKEIIGQSVAIIFTPQDRTAGVPQSELETAAEQNRAIDERLHMRKDSSTFWANGLVFPLRDEAGELRGFTKIMRNVTSQREVAQKLAEGEIELQVLNEELAAANEELQAANEEIQSNNDALTSQNSALDQTNQQLSSINDDLDNFIYSASHDLKAPIANIEGLLKALVRYLPAQTLQEENVSQVLSLISESIARFKRTIGHLTQVTQLQKEANQTAQRVDLSQIIKDVKLDLAPIIDENEAEITVEVAACPQIYFSVKNLRSILYNLLSNALKYRSWQRRPVIYIGCKSQNGYQVLTVQDNGLGMDLKGENKLFMLFRRLHDHVEGSGIGLYMVKKMVENAGGKIEVESIEGEGTTIQVYFKH